MTFTCPLCGDEWIFASSLCKECSDIKRFMKLYGKKRVCDMIANILLVNDDKIKIKTTKEKELLNNDLKKN